MNFTYQSLPGTIYFGAGQLNNLADIIRRTGGNRLFVIAEARNAEVVATIRAEFGDENVCQFSDVVQHVPRTVVDAALAVAQAFRPDLLVAIGGGSAIGLAKGIALATKWPILAIPTTYAGSEMTNVYGISADGQKVVGRDDAVLPKAVIYDPSLTATMPVSLAATSAMNAMAHLIEAVYAHNINPVTYAVALLGIRKLREGMEQLIAEKSLVGANEKIQFGAYLAGKSLCEVAMSLHHKAAHVLGGSFGLEHAALHTALLPYVLDFQLPALSPELVGDLNTTLDTRHSAQKLRDLADAMGAKTNLADIGFQAGDSPKAADLILRTPFNNPRLISRDHLIGLLQQAHDGRLSD